IHKTFKGRPGDLASIRRLTETGTDLDTLLSDIHTKVPRPFEIEWAAVNRADERQLLTLTILAYDGDAHTISSLARLLSLNDATVHSLLDGLGFITVDPDNHRVTFVSDAFRAFAASRLRAQKEHVYRLRIDDLQRNPDSEAALTS